MLTVEVWNALIKIYCFHISVFILSGSLLEFPHDISSRGSSHSPAECLLWFTSSTPTPSPKTCMVHWSYSIVHMLFLLPNRAFTWPWKRTHGQKKQIKLTDFLVLLIFWSFKSANNPRAKYVSDWVFTEMHYNQYTKSEWIWKTRFIKRYDCLCTNTEHWVYTILSSVCGPLLLESALIPPPLLC